MRNARPITKAHQWFIDRIGKRIYRKHWGCTCKSCLQAAHDGLVITGKDHADYLCAVSGELGIKYQDEPLQSTIL